jgi:hypothetical protein
MPAQFACNEGAITGMQCRFRISRRSAHQPSASLAGVAMLLSSTADDRDRVISLGGTAGF